MSASSHQWMLFGFDLRHVFRDFFAAWKTAFMPQGSRFRNLLDGPVRLYCYDENTEIIVGRPAATVESQAHLLPDSMVLTRSINVPRSAGVSVASVIALEVDASSPFSNEDTTFGWRLIEATSEVNVIAVAIVSKSAALAFLAAKPVDDPLAAEIWVQVDNAYIVINGFAEHTRNRRYVYRLKKMFYLLGICLFCLAGILSVPVMYKYYEQYDLSIKYSQLQAESKSVIRVRSSLSDKNKIIDALNTIRGEMPTPVVPLNEVTQLLADDVWLSRYEQIGKRVLIAGTAVNAAELMQQVSNHLAFKEVKAPTAIRQAGNSGLELFQLSFEVGTEVQ